MSYAASWVGYTLSTTPELIEHEMPYFDFGKIIPDDVDMVYAAVVVGLRIHNTGATNLSVKIPSFSVMAKADSADPAVYSAFELDTELFEMRYTANTANFASDPSGWTLLAEDTPVSLSDVTLDQHRIGYSQPIAIAIGVPALEAKKQIRKIPLQAFFTTVDI